MSMIKSSDADNGSEDVLDVEDHARIVRCVVEQAGLAGITEDEILRRGKLVAQHVVDMKLSAALYELFRADRIQLSLTDDETDIRIINRSAET